MLGKIKNKPVGYIVFTVLPALLGISALSFSGSIAVLTVIIGLLVAIFGMVMILHSIRKNQRGIKFISRIIFASILTILGFVVMFMNDKVFLITIVSLSAISATDAAFSLNLSFSARKHEVSGWWIVALLSIAVIASSFALVGYMPASTKVVSLRLGATLLALAALNILSAIWAAKCKTAEKAELYYEVYQDIKDSGESLQ